MFNAGYYDEDDADTKPVFPYDEELEGTWYNPDIHSQFLISDSRLKIYHSVHLATAMSYTDRTILQITYFMSTRWEHEPSMKALHWILRCAIVTISFQVYPIFFTSDSMSRRQVFLGRPLFLSPHRFHVRLVWCDVRLMLFKRVTKSTNVSSKLVLVGSINLLDPEHACCVWCVFH